MRERRRLAAWLGPLVLRVAALIAAAPALALLAWLLSTGLPALRPALLLTGPADMMREGGIAPALVGSAGLLGLATLIALPLGLAAAVLVSAHVPAAWLQRLLERLAASVAAVPSIIYGLFGLVLFVRQLSLGISWLAGSLTLAVLMLPLFTHSAIAVLRDVPPAQVEASLALGASRWQTIVHVIIPAALPGLTAAAMLAIARAAGETAPLLFTAAAFFRTGLPSSLLHQTMSLPTHLYLLVTNVRDAAASQLAGTGLALVMLSLGFLAISLRIELVQRQRRRR